jgi:hypothetical protein
MFGRKGGKGKPKELQPGGVHGDNADLIRANPRNPPNPRGILLWGYPQQPGGHFSQARSLLHGLNRFHLH